MRVSLNYAGTQSNVPFAKDIEFDEILIEIWAKSHTDAEKNAAARPPGLSCHFAIMSRGFHNTCPYSSLDAPAPTMPTMAIITLKNGMNGSCQTCAPRVLLNLEKSGMLTVTVVKPPVMEVRLLRKSQALAEPWTVAGVLKKLLPLPFPAFTHSQIIIAKAVGGTNIVLMRKSFSSLYVGIRRQGNWIRLYRKYDTIPCVVSPAEAGR